LQDCGLLAKVPERLLLGPDLPFEDPEVRQVSALCPNNERLACHLFVYLLIEMVPGLKEEILSWPIMKETS